MTFLLILSVHHILPQTRNRKQLTWQPKQIISFCCPEIPILPWERPRNMRKGWQFVFMPSLCHFIICDCARCQLIIFDAIVHCCRSSWQQIEVSLRVTEVRSVMQSDYLCSGPWRNEGRVFTLVQCSGTCLQWTPLCPRGSVHNQGAHASWKTWKMTNKFSMHGKLMEFWKKI